MKSNKLVPAAIASAVVGALVLTGCSQEPSDGFKKQCKKAGGTIERENDYEALGMGPVGFGVPKPPSPAKPAAPAPRPAPAAPKPVQKAPKVELPKTPKLPKNDAPKSAKTQKPVPKASPTGGLALAPTKGKKRGKKHDDNDFLCVKNGNVLFEEDE